VSNHEGAGKLVDAEAGVTESAPAITEMQSARMETSLTETALTETALTETALTDVSTERYCPSHPTKWGRKSQDFSARNSLADVSPA
jgi:hypothetical protein